MPGKRVQFDDETWQAIEAVAERTDMSFQDLPMKRSRISKKHKQPVGLKAALKESVGGSKAKRPSK